MKQVIQYRDMGEVEYGAAWQMQDALMARNLEIKARKFKADDSLQEQLHTTNYLLFCNHPHVYTLGKSGHMENLLVNDSHLRELDVSFYKTNRGGDITYHGPGQIVGYPIMDLELFFTDLGKYMRALEEAVIQTIAFYGIKGDRLPGATGVWLDAGIKGRERKICAMGVRCSRWITMHGLALNVNTDLKYFDYIVPCGISDKQVTSIERETGRKIDEEEVKGLLKHAFSKVFNATIVNETVREDNFFETVI